MFPGRLSNVVDHDVRPTSVRDISHFTSHIDFVVVQHDIGAHVTSDGEFFIARRRDDDKGPKNLRN